MVISGNTTLDIASGAELTYTGEIIDLLNFQLTMLGSGTFLNTNSILLSNSDSLLIIAGDVTIAKIKVAANSADGKGLLVRSTGAKVVNLDMFADMRLSYSDNSHKLNVENLNIDSTSKIIAENYSPGIGFYSNELTVTDVNGCFVSDTIEVLEYSVDIGVSEFISQ